MIICICHYRKNSTKLKKTKQNRVQNTVGSHLYVSGFKGTCWHIHSCICTEILGSGVVSRPIIHCIIFYAF